MMEEKTLKYGSRTGSVIDEPKAKVFNSSAKPISLEKEETLREYSEFGYWVLSKVGVPNPDGVLERDNCRGFTFRSRKVDSGRVTQIGIWFHPNREREMGDRQSEPVAVFEFDGEAFDERSWRIFHFADYFRWQDELKKLIPDGGKIIREHRDRMEADKALRLQRSDNDKSLIEGSSKRGKEWKQQLEENTEIFIRHHSTGSQIKMA